MPISARVICDSRNAETGDRLTTMIVTFPRYVLPELSTHRMLSKNAASSRAIPVKRQLEKVLKAPSEPYEWGRNQAGMQAGEALDEVETDLCRIAWGCAASSAVIAAESLAKLGVHKQVANRVLEPFIDMTTLVSATEWENFFALRVHADADPTLRETAFQMLKAYLASSPQDLKPDEWHIPFSDKMPEGCSTEMKLAIATARCARLSYESFDGDMDIDKDIELHGRLLKSRHFSPFEHCAQALSVPVFYGNFRGFMQYRKTFQSENRKANLGELYRWAINARETGSWVQ